MARLPDLEEFAREHGLKIGTIADLIGYRSRNETLIERLGARTLHTPQGPFERIIFGDKGGGVHLALHARPLGRGRRGAGARARAVHRSRPARRRRRRPLLAAAGGAGGDPAEPCGVAVLLNTTGDAATLLPQVLGAGEARPRQRAQIDLRTYGVGAQILRELGVARMKLLGSPRRMPSMVGYGLEITGFVAAPVTAG